MALALAPQPHQHPNPRGGAMLARRTDTPVVDRVLATAPTKDLGAHGSTRPIVLCWLSP